jgi:hypothetical protein
MFALSGHVMNYASPFFVCADNPRTKITFHSLGNTYFMAGLERVPHGGHVADALEGVVATAVCHLDDGFGNGLGQLAWVDEFRDTKSFGYTEQRVYNKV